MSSSRLFLVSFLGALFAIVASLLLVYTYVTLRLIPKLKKSVHKFVEEVGPRAVFEHANVDPAEAMQQLGISPEAAVAAITNGPPKNSVRVVFTCEDHGRCAGCPRVLAQFEAIVRHQGAESFDEVERKCYEQLRAQLASDALLHGESETERQRRIAARVIEALVREGCASSIAHAVVWSRKKEDRATFDAWLSAARAGCDKMMIDANEEDVA